MHVALCDSLAPPARVLPTPGYCLTSSPTSFQTPIRPILLSYRPSPPAPSQSFRPGPPRLARHPASQPRRPLILPCSTCVSNTLPPTLHNSMRPKSIPPAQFSSSRPTNSPHPARHPASQPRRPLVPSRSTCISHPLNQLAHPSILRPLYVSCASLPPHPSAPPYPCILSNHHTLQPHLIHSYYPMRHVFPILSNTNATTPFSPTLSSLTIPCATLLPAFLAPIPLVYNLSNYPRTCIITTLRLCMYCPQSSNPIY